MLLCYVINYLLFIIYYLLFREFSKKMELVALHIHDEVEHREESVNPP